MLCLALLFLTLVAINPDPLLLALVQPWVGDSPNGGVSQVARDCHPQISQCIPSRPWLKHLILQPITSWERLLSQHGGRESSCYFAFEILPQSLLLPPEVHANSLPRLPAGSNSLLGKNIFHFVVSVWSLIVFYIFFNSLSNNTKPFDLLDLFSFSKAVLDWTCSRNKCPQRVVSHSTRVFAYGSGGQGSESGSQLRVLRMVPLGGPEGESVLCLFQFLVAASLSHLVDLPSSKHITLPILTLSSPAPTTACP